MPHINNNQLDFSQSIGEKVGDMIMPTKYFESYLYDISLIATAVSDLTASSVSVTSPDATDLATAITLINEVKGDVNTLATDLNATITQINTLLAGFRASGKLDE